MELVEASCMFCQASRKSCRECKKTVCAKHAATGLCLGCLENIDLEVKRGRFATTNEEDERINEIGGPMACTYGEITRGGFRTLAKRLQLGETDKFVDLGSGLGTAVIQAVKEFGCAAACGIELGAGRVQLAEEARAAEGDDVSRRVQFLCADCADPALWAQEPLASVTVAFANNLLFGPELQDRLRRAVESASRLRVFTCTRPFTDDVRGFRADDDGEACRVETSWKVPDELNQLRDSSKEASGSIVTIYVRDPSGAQTTGLAQRRLRAAARRREERYDDEAEEGAMERLG